jgi:citrate synthase
MRIDNQFMTADQAAGALGVTKATLYAYTSRGQLQSEAVPGKPRERRYRREDVERLNGRKEARRDPARAAAQGLHWGSPVLDSAITLIQNGRLYYRGRDAVNLAATATLEETAKLLWSVEGTELQAQPCRLSRILPARLRSSVKDPFALVQCALPLAGAADLASFDLRPAAVRATGARILRLIAAIAAGRDSDAPVHVALQSAWAPGNAAAAEAIRTALVLCADHELNVSTFTARCAASAAATPYNVVATAMATLTGSRHGGTTGRVAALFEEAATPRRARRVLANRLQRGEQIPGFGHPLYPAGDPRAALLIRLAESSGNYAEQRLVRAVNKAGSELLHDLPNLDFGLVAMARSYRLPKSAPLMLFALGRTVGWIAHAIEQYASEELIRPRANYKGPAPSAPDAFVPSMS